MTALPSCRFGHLACKFRAQDRHGPALPVRADIADVDSVTLQGFASAAPTGAVCAATQASHWDPQGRAIPSMT